MPNSLIISGIAERSIVSTYMTIMAMALKIKRRIHGELVRFPGSEFRFGLFFYFFPFILIFQYIVPYKYKNNMLRVTINSYKCSFITGRLMWSWFLLIFQSIIINGI
jgi:hypothetical protein